MIAAPVRLPAATIDPGFGVYVHWPFCESKCPYCDFNSHVRERIDQLRWRRALLTEIDHFATLLKDAPDRNRPATSLFFGGGTPSLMPAGTVAAVIDRVAERFGLAADSEITLESNPGSADAARFRGYREAGVNRVSIGVQALDDRALRFLGRRHDVAEALAALRLGRGIFPRLSFDLIYARPGQGEGAWRDELARALALSGDHLSLYQLTIEEGTPFAAAVRRGELDPLDETSAARLYEVTQEVMDEAGLPAYEVSNHARPGAEGRHNLVYWRYGQYAGIGPGAHGRLEVAGVKTAFRQHRAPEAWLALVERQGHGTREASPLDAPTRFAEMAMMGLRLAEGLDRERVLEETGRGLDHWIDRAALARLAHAGLLADTGESLVATAAGRQRLNAVLQALLA